MEEREPLNIIEVAAIAGVLMVFELFLAVIVFSMGLDERLHNAALNSIVVIIPTGVVLALLMRYKELSYARLLHDSRLSLRGLVILLALPILLVSYGGNILLGDVGNLMLMLFPLEGIDIDDVVANATDPIYLSSTIVIAPVIEELLFRGIFVRSLLQRYAPRKVYVYTALVFAIAHLNPYQIPVAFVMGYFLAWLYHHSSSLLPCIWAHMTFNAISVLLFFSENQAETMAADGLLPMHSLAEQVLAFVIVGAGLLTLYRVLNYRPRQ